MMRFSDFLFWVLVGLSVAVLLWLTDSKAYDNDLKYWHDRERVEWRNK